MGKVTRVIETDFTMLGQLIDKLGLVAVLIFLLWIEKRQSMQWQERYTALVERLIEK